MTTKHTLHYLANTTGEAIAQLTTTEAKFRDHKYTNRADLTSLAIKRLRMALEHLAVATDLYAQATARAEPETVSTDKSLSVVGD